MSRSPPLPEGAALIHAGGTFEGTLGHDLKKTRMRPKGEADKSLSGLLPL